MNELGILFSTERMKCNFSQEYVSERLQLMGFSIDRCTYTKIENGNRNLNALEFFALVVVLKLDFSFVEKVFYLYSKLWQG